MKASDEIETRRQYEYLSALREKVEALSAEKGAPLTACVVTFGCQMNARDSEKLRGILLSAGFVETKDEQADFVVYNTCTSGKMPTTRSTDASGFCRNIRSRTPTCALRFAAA